MPSTATYILSLHDALPISEEHNFSTLLVTRGSDGMTLFERENGNLRRQDISSFTRGVYDVTGAGDTALGVFALGLAAGATRSQDRKSTRLNSSHRCSSYAVYRNLHSFPTRRSSDLRGAQLFYSTCYARVRWHDAL